jgi:hyperosmotically inducible protein
MKSNLRIKTAFAVMWMAALTLAVPAMPSRGAKNLDGRIRHEILMLPYYGVFDAISFEMNGNQVVLSGYVSRPILKSDAGNVVKRIPGVEKVDNRIEVLPLSSMDDQIRLTTYKAIYSYPTLHRYGLQPIAPIRIIVKNGQLTLEGYVDNKTDVNLAGILANGVPGVFHVTNNLKTTQEIPAS